MLRVTVDETLGWINLLLVWALFAAAGMRLAALRALPRALLASALVASVVAAVALVLVGPYSSALITTTATPGITNLAPPTLVLAFAGMAQVCVLLLLWPVLARLLDRDAVWVAVAVFASRAMELYLWHMLGFTLAIGGVLALGVAPRRAHLGLVAAACGRGRGGRRRRLAPGPGPGADGAGAGAAAGPGRAARPRAVARRPR